MTTEAVFLFFKFYIGFGGGGAKGGGASGLYPGDICDGQCAGRSEHGKPGVGSHGL